MFTRRIAAVALLALSSLVAAGGGAAAPQQGEMLREEFHQTYPLAEGARVTLENLNGNVRITAWDRNEVKVDAVKMAYKRDRLDEAKIDVRADAAGVRIETTYPYHTQVFRNDQGKYDNPAKIDYTLTVPRNARISSVEVVNGDLYVEGVKGEVRASSVNGRLTARGLAGLARLSTVNGNLEATFDRIPDSSSISLGSVNGNVVLTIPSDSNAELKAGSVHGAINTDFGLPVRRGQYVGYDLAGQLGQGGTVIKLGNVNGAIHIRHAQDGRPLSRATNLLADKIKSKEGDDDDDDEVGDSDRERVRAEVRRKTREAVRARTEVTRAQADETRARVQASREQTQAKAEAARDAAQVRVEAQRATRDALREQARERMEAQRAVTVEASRSRIEATRIAAEVQRDAQREAARARAEGQRAAREARIGTDFEGVNTLRLVERETKNFTVTGVPNINLETFEGSITVRSWDRQEVQVTASKRAATDQQMRGITVSSEQDGSTVRVVADFNSAYASPENAGQQTVALVNLDLFVPRNSALKLTSGDGRIEVEGVNGSIHLVTGDGRIEVRDSRGQLNARTGDGRVEVDNFDGTAQVKTGEGRISLGGRFAQLSAATRESPIVITLPSNFNGTIETDAESVDNDGGFTLTEEAASTRRLKRYRVGSGGNVLSLRTADGRLILRRGGQ